MKRAMVLGLMASLGSFPAAYGQEKAQPKPELKCVVDGKPVEGRHKIEYRRNGKTYIEYCSMGRKHVIVDSGDNG